MAEAILNKLAAGRATAISAGTKPAEAIDPVIVTVMREIGLDISRQQPKPLTAEMVAQADKVVTMGCGVEGVCPASSVETEDWEIEAPVGRPIAKVRQIRDQIHAKVRELLEEMS